MKVNKKRKRKRKKEDRKDLQRAGHKRAEQQLGVGQHDANRIEGWMEGRTDGRATT